MQELVELVVVRLPARVRVLVHAPTAVMVTSLTGQPTAFTPARWPSIRPDRNVLLVQALGSGVYWEGMTGHMAS